MRLSDLEPRFIRDACASVALTCAGLQLEQNGDGDDGYRNI
jgi:hypothetical protein